MKVGDKVRIHPKVYDNFKNEDNHRKISIIEKSDI